MRTLAPTLVLAATLVLVAPRAAHAGSPAGVRARASDCGSHHRRRRHRRRPVRRHRREEKKAAPPPKAEAAPPAASPPAASAAAAAGGAGSGTPLRRSRVMEFDARLVQGQTASSGAVYLFNRAPRRLPPLLKLKQSYLHLIVDPVLGPDYHDRKKGHR